ncbi:MAG: TolB-like protein, partial [Solirubrobacterales bacterium]|nr:TolB-like protein [Solirubrobacterales bacterium]
DSTALNLIAGGTSNANGSDPDVYLRDVATGTTTLVSRSTASATTSGNQRSLAPVISGNGRYVVWGGRASDLESPSIVSGTLSFFHILVRDLESGVTSFVDVNPAGDELSASGPGGSEVGPNSLYSITPDGHYVAFQSEGYNLIAGYTSPGSGADNVFRRDLLAHTTVLASPSMAGPTAGANDSNGFAPLQISDDGRYIAFEGGGDDLTPGVTAGSTHIYQRDVTAATTTLVDTASPGTAANGISHNARMSTDGRYVLFYTDAPDVVAGDANGHPDLVRWDRTTGLKTAVDVAAGTTATANGSVTFEGAISADGTRVAFASDATNLVAGYTGSGTQVYLRDLAAGSTQLLSSAPGSATAGANAPSAKAWLSGNGRRATWSSAATDLVAGFGNLNGSTPDFFTRAQTPDPDPVVDPAPEVTPPASTPPAQTPPAADPGNPLVPPETTGTPRPQGHGVTRRGTRKRDVMVGTRFADHLYGLGGDDSLKGRAGRDVLSGGVGDDRIDAVDGVRDTVDCGPGRHDRATVDTLDKVRGCEKVTVKAARR